MESVNPVVSLSEIMQACFGRNIETRVIGKSGPDHCPTITVEVKLPNGKLYQAEGKNKKLAKQRAAEKALDDFYTPLNNL